MLGKGRAGLGVHENQAGIEQPSSAEGLFASHSRGDAAPSTLHQPPTSRREVTQEPEVIVQWQDSVRVASSLWPPKAAVFVLESDKLPNGGWEGWGVDQGLSFHGWPIITFFTVPSVGTTCSHFPGWWLQGPWAVSNDN